MMAGSRLRVWRSLRLERLLAAAGAAAAGEEQEKTLLSRLCADIAAGAAPGTAGRPGVLPGLSLPLPPAPARAARSGPRGVPLGRAQPPAVRPDGGTAGLMAASDPGAAPRLPPARSLCWEGEGGGKKKKKLREKRGGKTAAAELLSGLAAGCQSHSPLGRDAQGVAGRPPHTQPVGSGGGGARPPPLTGQEEPLPVSPAPRCAAGRPRRGRGGGSPAGLRGHRRCGPRALPPWDDAVAFWGLIEQRRTAVLWYDRSRALHRVPLRPRCCLWNPRPPHLWGRHDYLQKKTSSNKQGTHIVRRTGQGLQRSSVCSYVLALVSLPSETPPLRAHGREPHRQYGSPRPVTRLLSTSLPQNRTGVGPLKLSVLRTSN